MRRALLVAAGALLAAGGFGLVACGDDDSDGGDVTLRDDSVIEYHYGDSSVEPQYHRSYTLTIRKDEVHVVIDSYGDVLQDETMPLPAEVWTKLVDDSDSVADVGSEADEDTDGCDGGTSRSLSIESGGETEMSVEFSVCGGANGDAADRVDAYVQPVIDAIPNWDTLVA